jgi:hypothetical protein
MRENTIRPSPTGASSPGASLSVVRDPVRNQEAGQQGQSALPGGGSAGVMPPRTSPMHPVIAAARQAPAEGPGDPTGSTPNVSSLPRCFSELERQHEGLFVSAGLHYERPDSKLLSNGVRDVDMDESIAVNAAEINVLGTRGLSTCIAICAKGKNQQGQAILGLHHYAGVESARDALLEMQTSMAQQGAITHEIYLVGGSFARDEDDADSYDMECDLLALTKEFPIKGARLHLTHGECDENGNDHSVDVVVTAGGIYYSHEPLYTAAQFS